MTRNGSVVSSFALGCYDKHHSQKQLREGKGLFQFTLSDPSLGMGGNHSSSPSRNRSRNHVCLLACSLAQSLPSTAHSCLSRKWYCPQWTVSFCIRYQSRHSITDITTGQSDLGSASVEVPSSQAALSHSSMVVTRKVLPCPEFILAGAASHGPLISPLASLVCSLIHRVFSVMCVCRL